MTTPFVLDVEAIADVPEAYADSIAPYAEREEKTLDEYAALCPALARPVAVGVLNTVSGTSQLHFDESVIPYNSPGPIFDGADVDLVDWDSEADLLEGVAAVLKKITCLVTFNGRGYDLPLLELRMKRAGIEVPAIVAKGVRQKPWEPYPHVDMLENLTFGRATRKYPLAVYCAAFGVSDPKAGGTGAEVAGVVERGETEKLLRYLQGDLEAEAELFEKIK